MSVLRGASLRARLTRTLVGLGLVSVVLLAGVNFVVVRNLLDRGARDQLVTLRDMRRDSIELAIDRLVARTAVLGSDPGMADALGDLEAAYRQLDTDLTDAELDRLREVYEPVTQRYDDAGVDHPTIDELLPDEASGRYLQYHYIAENPEEADARDRIDDAGDGSAYSTVHAEYHEYLAAVAASIGASDLLLVGLDTGDVVYSVGKYVDLGTDVVDGPYADAGLGEVWDALGGTAVNDATIADSRFYLPNSAAPVVHVAATVRSQAEVIGAVVITLRTDALTDIVTAGQQWELLGLGDTGEAYIVGDDRSFRTVPRPWFDDPTRYLERFDDIGGDDRVAGLIDFTGSPVLLHEIDNEAVRAALDGSEFVGTVDNYLDRATLAASAPLDVDGLGWIVVTEQQTSETRAELERFIASILVLLAVLLPLLGVIGVALARMLARPVRPLVESAGRIADGDYHTAVPDLGHNELGDVGHQLTAVAAELREQEDSVEAEERRIVTMLRSVLPSTLIERVRSGERELADVVDTATVIAVAVRGVPEPSVAEQDAVLELTTRLTEETTLLADEHGVERVQIALEQQLFVAGRGSPDTRAEDAVAFAVAVIDAVAAIGAEHGVETTAQVGLSAGLVATGVLGSRQVAFGMWGDSVGAAVALSAVAEPGAVVADATVTDQLDEAWRIEEVDDAGPGEAFVVRSTAVAAD